MDRQPPTAPAARPDPLADRPEAELRALAESLADLLQSAYKAKRAAADAA
jgi:hypothetical protein